MGPCFISRGGIRLGGDVGNFLELQCAFEADRQADAPAQVEEKGLLVVALGDLVCG